ncbi:ankyrin repeat protein [Moumouvirus australiensis]|uniref:Ankyrin repeat protein n=1 Tax=Moumouvirus australiensis TaxID=2109587 RepID=A0A2P1EMT8_9VIRU|nr:ankyrin repeat protein [Moumouvirus australiensis]AVL95182.1 ankyrin repeat protein [Moumouvirus australiensis]
MNTEYYIITSYDKFSVRNIGKIYQKSNGDFLNVYEAKNFPLYHYGNYVWRVRLPVDNFLFKEKEFNGISKSYGLKVYAQKVKQVNMVILEEIYYLLDPQTFVMLQTKGLDLINKTPEEWADSNKKYFPTLLSNTIYAYYFFKKNISSNSVEVKLNDRCSNINIEEIIKIIPGLIDDFDIQTLDCIIYNFDLFVEILVQTIEKDCTRVLEYLMSRYKTGIDINNIVNLAVENNKVGTLKYLLSNQASCDIKLNIDENIILSLQKGHFDIYHYLKYKCTNPDLCLETAALNGHSEIVKELLINGRDPIKALRKAAEGGNFETISVIFDICGSRIENIDIDLAITLVKQRIIFKANNDVNSNVEQELNIIEFLESFKCLNSLRKDEDYLTCDDVDDVDDYLCSNDNGESESESESESETEVD